MNDAHSRRNISVLLWVSALFGLAFGIYDLALPLYLKGRGFTEMQGSLVFAAPVAASILVWLWVGRISDRVGRKVFYTLSLLGASAGSLFTPFFPLVLAQVALKSVWETSVQVRDSLHGVFLYETAKAKFIGLVGTTEGVRILGQVVGLVVVGYGLGWIVPGMFSGAGGEEGYAPVLVFCGLLCLLTAGVFAWGLREEFEAGEPERTSFLREMVSLKLDPRLYMMMAFLFIFSLGLAATHTWVMYCFWPDKFGVDRAGMGWLMAVHRLVFALPLLTMGWFVRGRVHRHRRPVLIASIVVQAVSTLAAGVIANFWVALGVWLLHDLCGAGVWRPIRDELLQRYCRGQVRGTDATKALAVGQVGFVFGTLLGGWCYRPQTGDALRRVLPFVPGQGVCFGLPFVAGGIIMLASVVPLVLLVFMDPEERGEAKSL
jgi:MFS family permease